MSWRKIYKNKLVSVEEAAEKIESGDRCWINCTTAIPPNLCDAIADRYEELKDVNMFSALNIYPLKIYTDPKYIGHINYHSFFFGPYERGYERAGNITMTPLQFAHAETVLLGQGQGKLNLNAFISDATPPDEDGYMYFGTMGVAAGFPYNVCKKRILQINRNQYAIKNAKHGHRLHIDEVDWVCECDHPIPEFPKGEITEIDQRISQLILPLISDGSTLQIGLGGLANAIGYGLKGKKEISIRTEMFTDSMLQMAKDGCLTEKKYAGFGVGSHELCEYIASGNVELGPIFEVNNPFEIAAIDNFVSINSCIMTDLTGQVCSESVGHRNYSGVGGQLDYVRGANMSKGGKNILCLPSTTTEKSGKVRSSIMLNLPLGSVVTTPRTDVMYIATEYGIVNLFGKSLPERAELLISIAHPDFRAKLRSEARSVGIIKR